MMTLSIPQNLFYYTTDLKTHTFHLAIGIWMEKGLGKKFKHKI